MASQANNTVLLITIVVFLSLKKNIQCRSASTSKSWVRAGYFLARDELPVSEIESSLFTHLICGSAFINSTTYQLYINSSGLQSFPTFTNVVKHKNPSVKTLLAIWVIREQSQIFFSMLTHFSYRKSFIESSIRTARHYGFHGMDLYGPNTPIMGSDMSNLGVLLAEWRAAIDSEGIKKGSDRLILVMTGNYSPVVNSLSYPIEEMKKDVDWVHLRSYDYYVPNNMNFTYPHAALYDTSPNRAVNTNDGIREWINRGFPASKLVLGLPYYGYAYALTDPKDGLIGAPSSGPTVTSDGSMGYSLIKAFIRTYGYGIPSVYNGTYVVNYCKIAERWINCDDVEAIRAKVSYAENMGLLGYYAFHIGSDENWVLSRAAAQAQVGVQQKKQRLLKIILPTSAIFTIFVLGIIMRFMKQKAVNSKGIMKLLKESICKMRNIESATENVNDIGSKTQLVFSYRTIKAATNNFSSENKLGQGGFGPVYKGKLKKGQEIAVKRLSKSSNQGLEEFKNEVTLTATLQHVNLVRVLGYCTEREEKLLIYEYMPNKSLDLYLFDPSRQHLLDWDKRVHIIEGVIQGLLYLQEYSNSTIIHRDLKAGNILLDNKMNPKISDFGLARIFRKDESEANTSRIVGTYGYVPPEYVKKGTYSIKYDVYSFGVLLLQIISGKRNTCQHGKNEDLNLLEYAYDLWKEGQGKQFTGSALDDSSSPCKILKCLQVALLCVQENPVDRPSMLQVSSMFKNELTTINSPKKPAFSINRGEEHLVMQPVYSVESVSISQIIPR